MSVLVSPNSLYEAKKLSEFGKWRNRARGWRTSKLNLSLQKTSLTSFEKTGPSSENLQTQPVFGENGPKFGESPNSPRFWRKRARVRRISKLTPSLEKTGPSSENLQTQSLDSEFGENGPKFGESPNSPRVWRKRARVRRISKLTPSLEKTGPSSENLQTQARFLQTHFVKHAKKRSASVLVEKISVRMEIVRQNKRSAGEKTLKFGVCGESPNSARGWRKRARVWRISKLRPVFSKLGPELGESQNLQAHPSLEEWAGVWSISKLSLENLRTEFGESPN